MGNRVQVADRGPAAIAQVNGMRVHIQVNMGINHILVQLPGMLPDKRIGGCPIFKCQLHRGSKRPVENLSRMALVPLHRDAAQRNGMAGGFLPPFPQVHDLLQTPKPIGEPGLMDDHPRIHISIQYGLLDIGKQHGHQFRPVRTIAVEQQAGGGVQPGNGNAQYGQLTGLNGLL